MTGVFVNLVTLYIIGLIAIVSGQNERNKEKQIKDQMLDRYDGNILPSGTNGSGPVNVNVSLVVKNILGIDDSKMSMEVQLALILEWNDQRLSYTIFPPNSGPDHITLSSAAIQKVWIPDVYIVNSINDDIGGSNKFLTIFPNGDIHYSVLLTVKTSCPMELTYYPHDIQNCDIKISSYGYSSLDINLAWKDTSPVNVASDIHIAAFQLDSITNVICNSVTPTGIYSCLKVGLALKRQCTYYLVQVYIPFCMLVIVSWLSYWLHPIKTATGRLTLAIVTLGLGVIGCVAFNSSSPPVAYTKAVDVFTGTCLTFIFISVVEFVIVNYLNNYGSCCTTPGKNPGPADSSEHAEQQTPLNPSGEEKGQTPERSVKSGAKTSALIDVGFRIGMPILFLLFLIIYWLVYV